MPFKSLKIKPDKGKKRKPQTTYTCILKTPTFTPLFIFCSAFQNFSFDKTRLPDSRTEMPMASGKLRVYRNTSPGSWRDFQNPRLAEGLLHMACFRRSRQHKDLVQVIPSIHQAPFKANTPQKKTPHHLGREDFAKWKLEMHICCRTLVPKLHARPARHQPARC